MGGLVLTFAGQSLLSDGLTLVSAELEEIIPDTQANLLLTFDRELSGADDGLTDWSVNNAFGNAWNDVGSGGVVVPPNQYNVSLFSAGPGSGPPNVGNFSAGLGPLMAADGSSWGAQDFPVTLI
jgi:hypothetical protein